MLDQSGTCFWGKEGVTFLFIDRYHFRRCDIVLEGHVFEIATNSITNFLYISIILLKKQQSIILLSAWKSETHANYIDSK